MSTEYKGVISGGLISTDDKTGHVDQGTVDCAGVDSKVKCGITTHEQTGRIIDRESI